jgi:hypothetical protein
MRISLMPSPTELTLPGLPMRSRSIRAAIRALALASANFRSHSEKISGPADFDHQEDL